MQQRYRLGTCKNCGGKDKQLIAGYCVDGKPWCYTTKQQERYALRRKEKEEQRKSLESQGFVVKEVKPIKKVSEVSLPHLLQIATAHFNHWIKERDSQNNYFTCISCGHSRPRSLMQCGHYRPSTYSELRFNEDNCSGECENCNCNDPNHLIGYRKNLIEKIGEARVLWLESAPLAKDFKWDREELLEIIKKYKS